MERNNEKLLLDIEIVLSVISCLFLLSMVLIGEFLITQNWLKIVLIVLGIVVLLVGCYFSLKIEQMAGYYECQKCGNRYVPTFSSVLWSMHINRTRFMKCPKCHEKSWQKKVIDK